MSIKRYFQRIDTNENRKKKTIQRHKNILNNPK